MQCLEIKYEMRHLEREAANRNAKISKRIFVYRESRLNFSRDAKRRLTCCFPGAYANKQDLRIAIDSRSKREQWRLANRIRERAQLISAFYVMQLTRQRPRLPDYATLWCLLAALLGAAHILHLHFFARDKAVGTRFGKYVTDRERT